ncbi:DUF4328 domain-containing protein [Phenylobacterium terrae]|uniref:DUF4328 domain-containing protein n=1 Tax=Phenylobacterium terrae TaxID=2665495 RepID=A0ABW4MWN5_9CAUL
MLLVTWLHLRALSGLDPAKTYDPVTGVAETATLDILLSSVALLQLVIWVIAAFLVLKWIYRTKLNAHELATGLQTSPGWAVGWFFVPVVSLWMPFESLRETWKASHDPASWPGLKTPALLYGWWALWILSSVIGLAALPATLQADTVRELHTLDVVAMVTYPLNIVVNLMFAQIVRRLSEAQTHALSARAFA